MPQPFDVGPEVVLPSAFTSETRDLIGITNIQDLTDFTPGLSYASTVRATDSTCSMAEKQ